MHDGFQLAFQGGDEVFHPLGEGFICTVGAADHKGEENNTVAVVGPVTDSLDLVRVGEFLDDLHLAAGECILQLLNSRGQLGFCTVGGERNFFAVICEFIIFVICGHYKQIFFVDSYGNASV